MADDDDFLAELIAEEGAAKKQQRERLNDAVAEYVLARYKHHLNPDVFAPSLLWVARKYHVPRGMLEHKINSLRQRLEEEVEDGVVSPEEAHSIGEWLGYLLNGAAKAQREKLDDKRTE